MVEARRPSRPLEPCLPFVESEQAGFVIGRVACKSLSKLCSDPCAMFKTLVEARDQMGLALDLLDSANAPADIGAHLDLALQRLGKTIELCEASERPSACSKQIKEARQLL